MTDKTKKRKTLDDSKNTQLSIIGEFWYLLKTNKKWWLLPIIVVMILFAILIIVGSSPLAPFIYPLF